MSALLGAGGAPAGESGRHPWVPSSRRVEKRAWPSEGASPRPRPRPRRVNVGCGPAEQRVLLTGLHAVADIYCERCKTTLGWKYVSRHGDRMGADRQGGSRAGGGEAAHPTARLTTGWAQAEACGCDPVVMLTLTHPACLAPTPGPAWAHRGGRGGGEEDRPPAPPRPAPPQLLSATRDPESQERGVCQPSLLDRPAGPCSAHSVTAAPAPDTRSPAQWPLLGRRQHHTGRARET